MIIINLRLTYQGESMNKPVKIFVIVLLIIFALVLLRDPILKVTIEQVVKGVAGISLRMKSFQLGLVKGTINIKGIRVYNPRGFKEKIMVDMPEIYVDFNPGALSGLVHFEQLRMHLKEFIVIKNKEGKVNIKEIKVVKESEQKKEPTKKPAAEKAKKKADMRIDLLKLKVDKVVYKDYTVTPPSVKEYNVNIDVQQKNISDLNGLIATIISQALMKTAIGSLADVDMGALQDTAQEYISKIDVEALKKIADPSKIMGEGGSAEKAVTDATEKITDMFKGF